MRKVDWLNTSACGPHLADDADHCRVITRSEAVRVGPALARLSLPVWGMQRARPFVLAS